MKINVIKLSMIFICATLFCPSAGAQLTLNGGSYNQDFNAISNGLPVGWSVRTNATATTLGTIATNFNADGTWAASAGEFRNCASTVANSGTNFTGIESTTIQGNCTNRALAIRQGASFGDPGAAFVLNITNTHGMTNFQLSLDFLMLNVQLRSTVWTVDYGIGANPTSFTPLTTFVDPGIFGATHADLSFGSALDGKDTNVWIRIIALSPTTGSNSRDTFGIDNFSLSWTTNGVLITRPSITSLILTNGNVQIDFTGDTGDSPSTFGLQCIGRCSDVFGDTGAIITQTSPGHFRAVSAMNGSQQFYRVKR